MLAAAVCAGCTGGAAGLLTGSAPAATDAPSGLANDNPQARPIAVAWTSARAQRCGFYFDPAKLRASYLAYEAKQSGGDQLARVETTYDKTFKTIRERISGDPDYCTDRKSAEIKAELQRHLAGDFTPNFPKPKVEETCWLACGDGSSEQWTADKFWEEQNKRMGGAAR
jgi:hypothetical protein